MTSTTPIRSKSPSEILNSRSRWPRNIATMNMVLNGSVNNNVKASPNGINNMQLNAQIITMLPSTPCNIIRHLILRSHFGQIEFLLMMQINPKIII